MFSAHPTKSLIKNPSISKYAPDLQTDRPRIKSQKKVTFKLIEGSDSDRPVYDELTKNRMPQSCIVPKKTAEVEGGRSGSRKKSQNLPLINPPLRSHLRRIFSAFEKKS